VFGRECEIYFSRLKESVGFEWSGCEREQSVWEREIERV